MINHGATVSFIKRSSKYKISHKNSNLKEKEPHVKNDYEPFEILKDYENRFNQTKNSYNKRNTSSDLYTENNLNHIVSPFDNLEIDLDLIKEEDDSKLNTSNNNIESFHKKNSSNKLKELFKDYNNKLDNTDKIIQIKTSEEEEKFIQAHELKRKFLKDLAKRRKELKLLNKSSSVIKPKTEKQIQKILKSKNKRNEKLKLIRKTKQKKKEKKKNSNVFLNSSVNKKNLSGDYNNELSFQKWNSLMDWELRKKFENKGYDIPLVFDEITKLTQKNYFDQINNNEEMYLSKLDRLENFTCEEYKDEFKPNSNETIKEELSEKELEEKKNEKLKKLEEIKRKIENYQMENKRRKSSKENNLENITTTILSQKKFNNNPLNEDISNPKETLIEKEIQKINLKPLIQFELKQRILNYQNRWYEKYEVKDLINFWKDSMNKSSWKRRIKTNETKLDIIEESIIQEHNSTKNVTQNEIKNIKDKLNLKPVYIKPSKDILDIIPFCNNIYTIQRNDT